MGGGLRRPTLHPASCLISTVTRSPGHQPSLVVSSDRLPDIACAMSRGLSRESELVRVHIYVFDPVFNEANESSSACSSELRVPVETSTPPFWRAGEYDRWAKEQAMPQSNAEGRFPHPGWAIHLLLLKTGEGRPCNHVHRGDTRPRDACNRLRRGDSHVVPLAAA